MIYINRSRTDARGRAIRPPRKWFDQAKKATQAAIANPRNHRFDNKVYACDLVRAALEELFHNKCSYCEQELPESSWNVEHFRPKGRIAENRKHPGYYWLAYEWKNLYPSCVPCNQRRRDKPVWGDTRNGTIAGKLDQFPLLDESTRANKPGDDIDKEKKLLLDPCVDDPEKHLAYGVNGEIFGLDEYGKATIEICFLWRRRLKRRRAQIIRETSELLRLVDDLRSIRHKRHAQKFQKVMDRYLLSDACVSAGVARAVISNPDAFAF